MEEGTFVTAGGMEAVCSRYHAVVVALYPDAETAHAVAERLIDEGVPVGDISVVVSEGRLKASLDAGVCIIPSAEFRGVQHKGAFGGAFLGGAGGILLGAEIVLLGFGAVFALPVLAGATLLGVALGSAFSDMALREEGTAYRMHLQKGGTLLAIYTVDSVEADRVEALLRRIPAVAADIGKHPLRHPVSH